MFAHRLVCVYRCYGVCVCVCLCLGEVTGRVARVTGSARKHGKSVEGVINQDPHDSVFVFSSDSYHGGVCVCVCVCVCVKTNVASPILSPQLKGV